MPDTESRPDQRPDPTTDPMPTANPLPSSRLTMLARFRRIMKWMALLSIAVAAIAVALVASGDNGLHVHMLIARALGAG